MIYMIYHMFCVVHAWFTSRVRWALFRGAATKRWTEISICGFLSGHSYILIPNHTKPENSTLEMELRLDKVKIDPV